MLDIVVAMGLLLAPPPRPVESTCPADHHTATVRVATYLTHGGFADHRQTLGLNGFAPSSAHVLTDSADLTMCQRLVAQFGAHGSQPNWRWTAYKLGDYYLVSWRYVNTDGGVRIGLNPWIIVDADLQQLGRFAS